MDSGDILALISGITIVILVAVLANPQYVSWQQVSVENPSRPAVTAPQTQVPVLTTTVSVEPSPVVTPFLPKPDAPPYRILYTDKPFSYPLYKIPENMETFGASEIPWQTREWVPFAFVENTRGGLTRVFSVPYPVWLINTTVVAENHPQYGIFRMVLCYADTGGIIKGEEILRGGRSYRIVQSSNTDMYMIISVENIDSYYISLETPGNYYDTYRAE
ncbi:MAG: hypothetical protein LUQ04_02085 [Methanoregula sp.]|nr:hypothetical protein [Methanoregula sp.]